MAKWARLLRPTIQFFLVAFAVYVGYTRVSDYKHHWSDVLVGLLQGALVAVLNVSIQDNFFQAKQSKKFRVPTSYFHDIRLVGRRYYFFFDVIWYQDAGLPMQLL